VMAALGIDASVRMEVAIATSLAAIIPASFARACYETSGIDWPLLQRWTVPMLAGVVVGSVIVGSADGRQLAVVFAVIALLIVLHLMLGTRRDRVARRLPANAVGLILPALAGVASTLTGIGGNTIGVPLLHLCDVPRSRAVGTASVLALVIAVPAVLGAIITGWHAASLPPWSWGYLNLVGFGLIAPILLVAEPAGAALAHMIDVKRLRLVFAALVIITTARMLWDALV
jgi:uncharacterized membrane protein YfcA